jgi:hypothetical protein
MLPVAERQDQHDEADCCTPPNLGYLASLWTGREQSAEDTEHSPGREPQ